MNDFTDRATGRPSTFTAEIAATLCARIAAGESLRRICDDDGMPGTATVYGWLTRDAAFAEQYARAREQQADHYADEIIHIADTEPDPNKARVRIDARKWTASKLRPKVYGDRLQLDADVIVKLTDDQLETRLTDLLQKAGVAADDIRVALN